MRRGDFIMFLKISQLIDPLQKRNHQKIHPQLIYMTLQKGLKIYNKIIYKARKTTLEPWVWTSVFVVNWVSPCLSFFFSASTVAAYTIYNYWHLHAEHWLLGNWWAGECRVTLTSSHQAKSLWVRGLKGLWRSPLSGELLRCPLHLGVHRLDIFVPSMHPE